MLQLVIETNRVAIGKENLHFGVWNPHGLNGVLDSRMPLKGIMDRALSVSTPQQIWQSSEKPKPRRKFFQIILCPHLSPQVQTSNRKAPLFKQPLLLIIAI
jgi:hypothetical protein